MVTALLLETVTSALNFLSLSLAWEYWVQGALVICAALIPLVRQRRRTKTAQAPA
jgi:ribose transport system ATP-binding protein